MECGKPLRITYEEAVNLECQGIHFIDTGDELTPVQSKGLIVGSHSHINGITHGEYVRVGAYCDLYRCHIGAHTKVKHYVEIQGDVSIGTNCKIESFVFISSGAIIGNRVFIGPHTMLLNDLHPRSLGNWKITPVIIEDDVSVGGGATLLPGVTLHEGCRVGAGAVVVKDVPVHVTVVGNPAKVIRT